MPVVYMSLYRGNFGHSMVISGHRHGAGSLSHTDQPPLLQQRSGVKLPVRWSAWDQREIILG